jgi:hypothetical protein
MKTPSANLAALLGLAVLVGCTPEGAGPEGPNDPENPSETPTLPTEIPPASDSEAPFPHMGEPERDPFVVFEEMVKEGPREYTSRIHGCTKMPYAVVGAYLRTRGININNNTAGSAGALYKAAQSSIGVANLPARVRDGKEWTTAAYTDVLDIMGAAVPELGDLADAEGCKKGGVAVKLFGTDASGATTLDPDGVTCLLGMPPTPEMLELATTFIKQATSDADGRILVVASLMASAQMCQ